MRKLSIAGFTILSTILMSCAIDRWPCTGRWHDSRATVQAQFAITNTEYLPLQESTKIAMEPGFNSLAIGTAWARVEAGKHHPSDVLAGWSPGYLVSELTRVFLVGDQQSAQVSAQVSSESWQISYQRLF